MKYTTIEDIRSIVSNDIRESVSLEYKASDILSSKNAVTTICKTVSAFANSAGGQFITGVESQEDRPMRLDGGTLGPSRLDWFYQIINGNTFPALENFEVREIADGGYYYVVDVPVSINAPHQSIDKRHFKRRGPHSDPMEQYEIDDVRNRPKTDNAPLRVEIVADGFLAMLRLYNSNQFNRIDNLQLSITANVDLKSSPVRSLNDRTIKQLGPAVGLPFLLDSFHTMLQQNSEAEIFVKAFYNYKGCRLIYNNSFCIGDYAGSSIVNSPTVRAIESLTEKIGDITKALKSLKGLSELLERSVDGSGVRVSHRTMLALKGEKQLFDPSEFDYKGYQIVCDISVKDAIQLHSIFHTFGDPESRHIRYREIAASIRDRFEKAFRVEFE